MDDNLLEAEHLSITVRKGKKTFYAVKDISFAVKRGEIAGLVGESGCGKSLTALAIMGLLPEGIAAAGRIAFDGQNLRGKTEKELRRMRGKALSMIFQESQAALNPLIRAGDQIAESLELHGERDKRRAKERSLAAIRNMGLSDAEKIAASYPHQLSGGMCQRVMIALAMINRPRLLIADEPTAALDGAAQTQILRLLKRLNEELGTAILFISHDLQTARELCGKTIVMYGGRIAEEGATPRVFSRPLHPYTQGLLAAIPHADKKGRPLADIPGRVPPIEEEFEGCRFAPRCPLAAPPCRLAPPEKTCPEAGHAVYCPRSAP